jgi:hypothetical protein
MKALTISQPYASLIADGSKFVENRTWPTNYRGQLAIHAGKGSQYLTRHELREYPTGCIIAIADLTSCVRLDFIQEMAATTKRHRIIPGSSKSWPEVARHKHVEGPWCWILENVRQIEHVPVVGKQGLWNFEATGIQGVLF